MKIFNFLILTILTIVLTYTLAIILDIDNLVYNSLIDTLTDNQIDEYIDSKNKWNLVGYVIMPIILFLKISIIAAALDIGCFFFNKKIKYIKLFNIVVKAEFVFVLVIAIKIIWFYIFQQKYTLEDVQYFYPLSALNIIGYDGLQSWFIYPFQVLNLFELTYWFLLAYLLGKELKITIDKGLTIIASSYGAGLTIWVIGVMFLTLNMS